MHMFFSRRIIIELVYVYCMYTVQRKAEVIQESISKGVDKAAGRASPKQAILLRCCPGIEDKKLDMLSTIFSLSLINTSVLSIVYSLFDVGRYIVCPVSCVSPCFRSPETPSRPLCPPSILVISQDCIESKR